MHTRGVCGDAVVQVQQIGADRQTFGSSMHHSEDPLLCLRNYSSEGNLKTERVHARSCSCTCTFVDRFTDTALNRTGLGTSFM